MRNFELPGRSAVHSINGMAATSHPLATLTAVNILRDGGNAMDAAVAACAVQCVVEPQSTGIGGDCFVLFAPGGGGEIIGYNGSGRAPVAATPEWFARQGITEIGHTSPHAVTVPGAIDAWVRLVADHGRKTLGELLQPAIAFAREGYPVYSRVAFDWRLSAGHLQGDPTAARIFLPGGKPPQVGSLHRQPELAATLTRIAERGRDGFYTGLVAEDIVSYLNGLGGLHSLEDFAEAGGEYVSPIRTTYRGFEVYECPPNGQGIVALEMLNILSGFALSELEPLSVERLHLEIEAARLAYRDRNGLIADPKKAQVPVEWLLSDDHAADLRGAILKDRVMDELPPPHFPAHGNTVYLCVVDHDRNAVSFINSLFQSFGAGLVSPRTGVLLQNRGCGFVLYSGHPNCIAPRKRPLHTIIPGMLAKDGRVVMPFGVMGADYQPTGHTHLLTNLIDFGLDLQQAIDLPRVFPTEEGVVEVESGVSRAIVAGLRKLGHKTCRPTRPLGGGQAIWIDWEQGVLTGGSDPRKDGCALGY
ncbi:MAG: gamma-glutamyltransferase [Candidatus Binatia bacterium]